MKKFALYFLLAINSTLLAQKQFLGEIVYRIDLKHKNADDAIDRPHIALDPSQLYFFVDKLLSKVKNNEIVCFSPEYPFTDRILSHAEVMRTLVLTDTIEVMNENGEFALSTISTETNTANIGAVQFHEEWYLNTSDFSVEKKVIGLVLLKDYNDRSTGEFRGYSSLFYIKLNSKNVTAIEKPELLVTPNIQTSVFIKNQEESSREEMWWHENLEPSKRYLLTNTLLTSAKMGKVDVYDIFAPYKNKLNTNQIKKITTYTDTVFAYDELGNMISKVIEREISPHAITKLQFNESWYFDADNLIMYKKVNGISPMEEKIDLNTGELRGHKLLYYVASKNSDKNYQTVISEYVNKTDFIMSYNTLPYPKKEYNPFVLNGIDTARYKSAIAQLLASAETGKIPVTDAINLTWGGPPQFVEMPLDKVFSTLHRSDTIFHDNPTFNKITRTDVSAQNTTGIKFIEKWDFNPQLYSFQKRIVYFSLYTQVFFEDGSYKGSANVLGFKNNSPAITLSAKTENIIGKNVTYDVKISCPSLSESVTYFYEQWYDNCIEPQKRAAIIGQILDDIKSGKIKAYLPDGKYKTKLNSKQLDAIYNYKEIIGDNIFSINLDYSKVPAIRFHETWYFDKATNSFYKKVDGITLLRQGKPDQTESYVPLFYVPMN